MSIDTLTLSRELRAADFAQPQAEALAAAIGKAVTETSATKADLAELRAATKADLAELRAATKADLAELRAATKADLQQAVSGLEARIAVVDAKIAQQVERLSGEIRTIGGDIKTSAASLEATLIKWFIGAVFALGGLMVALTKL